MRRIALLSGLVLAVVLVAFFRPREVEPLRDRRIPPPSVGQGVPGIVVLCIDTLRADGVSLSGAPRGLMPAFEAFARGATVFPDAVASASWTPPSIATMLTGLLPAHHGVHGERDAGTLVGSVRTLAESLSAAGFSTAGVTAGGWVVREQGIAQGFDTFEGTFDAVGPEAAVAAWAAKRPADRRFFLFLHTYAAHDPYGDKTGYFRGVVEPEDPEVGAEAARMVEHAAAHAGEFPPDALAKVMTAYLSDVRARATFGRVVGRAGLDRLFQAGLAWLDGPYAEEPTRLAVESTLRTRYEAQLPYVDRVIARTLAALDEAKLPAGTAILLVADHGEAFGEHGYLGHGRFLHDELLRVPFALAAPGRLAAGGSIACSGGIVDVTPTLLDLAGLAVPAGLDGRSLLSLSADEASTRPVFAESERSVRAGGAVVKAKVVSVRTLRAKSILTYDATHGTILSEEVFDLTRDPGERTPLAAVDIERLGGAFCRAVHEVRETARRLSGESARPSPAGCAPEK